MASTSSEGKKENTSPVFSYKLTKEEEEKAIQSFVRLLQYETVSATAPDSGAYVECANYLQSTLKSIGCFSEIFYLDESPKNCPVVIALWEGSKPDLPVILLNSHYDVVPADPNDWYPDVTPFSGKRTEDGKIYGRGAQDMKCVCIQYIEAVRKLHKEGFTPNRSVYLTFVPDEEIGGAGMAAFLASSLYQDNIEPKGIALALDEGLASTTNIFSVFYGERLPWWVNVTANGNTGHGSRFIENTAVEQLVEIMNKALAFREGQRELLHGSGNHKHSNCSHSIVAANKSRRAIEKNGGKNAALGDVTSLNITTIQAGVRVADTFAYNCVPPIAKCSFDIRISPHLEPTDIKNMLNVWCQECSKTPNSITWGELEDTGHENLMKHALTSTSSTENPWYAVFSKAMSSMNLEFVPEVFPAATDSRFLRALGIRALGFSPMRNSEILLHENNEYLLESVFLEGVSVYCGLIQALAGVEQMQDEK